MQGNALAFLFLFARRQSEDMSVLAQDYPSAPANPSSLAKRDARGLHIMRKLLHIGKNRRNLYENIDFCRTNGTIENELLCLETYLKE